MAYSSSAPLETPAQAAGVRHRPGLRVNYQKFVDAAFALFVALGAVVILEPSPYDLLFFIALPVWFVGGFSVNRSFFVLAAILFGYTMAGFAALIPHWDSYESYVFQYLSAYLSFTALFFALFFGNDAERRAELCFKAYALGAFVASLCAIAGYFDLGGLAEVFTRNGRAMGTFKDPNVYGSFTVLATVYLAQSLVLGRARWPVVASAVLLTLVAGVFLSFSRGSWGATAVATMLMAGSAYRTTRNQAIRRRIAVGAVLAIIAIALVLIVLLSIEETRALFLERASVTQDYDEGPTGRFGNQMRSIPMLLDRFFGFGPLLFRNIFGLEPHNSYIGAFANAGWIGGLSFILLVAITTYVGFGLIVRASPYREAAQVAFPALFVTFLQGFQIDIDHWRHFYLLLGAVWGLEAARQKWEAREAARRLSAPACGVRRRAGGLLHPN